MAYLSRLLSGALLQGYGPLQSWAYQLMLQLHHPASLPPSPVGFDVTIAPGASAALDALVSAMTCHDVILCDVIRVLHDPVTLRRRLLQAHH